MDKLLTNKEQEYLQAKIENEGFDYCFRFYSSFSDIQDEEFQKIREQYREVAGKLASYIDDPEGYRGLQKAVDEAMTNNTQLPAEVADKIQTESLILYPIALHYVQGEIYCDTNENARNVWLAGATEYATRLHELQTKYDNILATESGHESKTENVWQSGYASGHEAATEKAGQKIRALKGSIETHKRSYDARSKDYDELDERLEAAEELLKKFISRHEAGLLPDRFIYQEIKNFLDGKTA